jgi:histidyl-tRNA synthetase
MRKGSGKVVTKAVKGMNDILPVEIGKWQYLEEISRKVFELYGYSEIRTPILEETSLFTRSIGENTDIVSKEMYSFSDSKGRKLSLRPEETAPVLRAYLEHNLHKKIGFIKLYYIGPMFRSEKPQSGRSRQFHQIGAEAIGSYSPYLDCESIALLVEIFRRLELKGWVLKLNSVGCEKCRPKFRRVLREFLKQDINLLCPDCQRKFNTNIFRILDCKKSGCRAVTKRAPVILNYLCKDCQEHFENVKQILDLMNISYQIDPHLVRGLDYYTRTTFEFVHHSLGAQNAIAAGGRYDNLAAELGGPRLGACGMSIGMERVLMVLKFLVREFPVSRATNLYLVTLGDEARRRGYKLLQKLREQNVKTHIDYEGKSLKAQLRTAGKLNSKYVVLLGEDELKKDIAILKNMETGKQSEIKLDRLVKEILAKI